MELYQRRYGTLLERYETIKGSLNRITNQRQERRAKHENITRFLGLLSQSDLLIEFDEGLWRTTVDTLTVRSEHDILFAFKDGTQLPWRL